MLARCCWRSPVERCCCRSRQRGKWRHAPTASITFASAPASGVCTAMKKPIGILARNTRTDMGILGRLFGGDAATVDALARALSERNIEFCQNPTPANRAAEREAYNAYIAAAPDSPLARQAARTHRVETHSSAGLTDAEAAAYYGCLE